MWLHVDLVWTNVSEERRFTKDLHGATSQKTASFIVTAVKTSNFTNNINDNNINSFFIIYMLNSTGRC
jgi:hypothetical protein